MQQIWPKAENVLKEYLEDRYQRWLENIVSVTRQNNYVFVSVTDELSREWMENNLTQTFDIVLEEVSGERLKTFFITPDSPKKSPPCPRRNPNLPLKGLRAKNPFSANRPLFLMLVIRLIPLSWATPTALRTRRLGPRRSGQPEPIIPYLSTAAPVWEKPILCTLSGIMYYKKTRI